MSRWNKQVNPCEKDRQRLEIAREIENFIAKGGRIEVLSDSESQMARRIGSVWHGDEAALPDTGSSSLD